MGAFFESKAFHADGLEYTYFWTRTVEDFALPAPSGCLKCGTMAEEASTTLRTREGIDFSEFHF
jgi:hypothetical protein